MNELDVKTIVLDAYLQDEVDMGRFTSQDICDRSNLFACKARTCATPPHSLQTR